MSYYAREQMEIFFHEKDFQAKLLEYNLSEMPTDPKHPFLTQYLQPLLQSIANEIAIATQQSKPYPTISVVAQNRRMSCSSYNHTTHHITICYNSSESINRVAIQLANDIRHEVEHAAQSSGILYQSDNERMLVAFSRFYYHTAGPLYFNNYIEMRARYAEMQMHIERHDSIPATAQHIDEKVQSSLMMSTVIHHLLPNPPEDVSRIHVADWVSDTIHRLNHSKPCKAFLKKLFPELTTHAARIQQAKQFLQNFALPYMQQWADTLNSVPEIVDKAQKATYEEYTKIQQRLNQQKMRAIAQQLNIPVIKVRTLPNDPHARLFPDISIQNLKEKMSPQETYCILQYNESLFALFSQKSVSHLPEVHQYLSQISKASELSTDDNQENDTTDLVTLINPSSMHDEVPLEYDNETTDYENSDIEI